MRHLARIAAAARPSSPRSGIARYSISIVAAAHRSSTSSKLAPWQVFSRGIHDNCTLETSFIARDQTVGPQIIARDQTVGPQTAFLGQQFCARELGGVDLRLINAPVSGIVTAALRSGNGRHGGNGYSTVRDQNHNQVGKQGRIGVFQVLPFSWLQLRSCSGIQIPGDKQDSWAGEREEPSADRSRAAALEKLSSLVEGWILETEGDMEGGEHGQEETSLTSSSGIVDDWNFKEWQVREGEDLSKQLQVGELESSQGQELQDGHLVSQEKGMLASTKKKKVYGIDKCLPPKVTVEFTEATSLAEITVSDVNKLFNLSKEDGERFFPEGLPRSLTKEFEISGVNALLVRNQVLKLCGHLKHMSNKGQTEPTNSSDRELIANPNSEVILSGPTTYLSLNAKKKLAKERRFLEKADLGSNKQIVLDGLPGSGKSVALAMLVLWARAEGWLVFYVPSAKEWTHGGVYYKNKLTGLWDSPLQATSMLENFLKAHGDLLEVIPCRVFDPLPLGEGPGLGLLSGPQAVPVQEGFTLKELIQFGIQTPHAAVGVVVRLRKELSLVDEVPVLIAVDEFNSWFTFSEHYESTGEFARRQIHARELAMVQAFRDMTYGPIIVGAFSHSTSVGKLPKQLPGVPQKAKVFLDRYDFFEASVTLKHYLRQLSPNAKFGKRARRALYVLTNGNATELRDAAFLKAAATMDVPAEAVM